MTSRTIILLVLFMVFSAPVQSQNAKASALALRDLNGRTVRLSDYRGKVVLINFWATWCPPCRAEMPDLVRWQSDYRMKGLQVIGITTPPHKKSVVRRFTRSVKVNYPILFGNKETKGIFFRGETLPLTVIIDREGNIREVIEGILLPEEFEQKIKPLLSGKLLSENAQQSISNRASDNPTK